MAATLDDIKDLLERNLNAQNRRAQQENVTVDITSADVEEANERVKSLREDLVSLRAEQRGYTEDSEEYKEIADDLLEVQTELNKEYARTQDELKKTREEQQKTSKAFKQLGDAVLGMSEKINDVQDFARELERTGAASKEVSRMAIQMGDSLRISGVDYEEATEATRALVANVTDFTMMSKEMQKSLMTDAALFAEVGVSNEVYTKNLQISMKSLGMSADQAAANLRDMRKTALSLNVPVSDLMEDFAGAEEKLAQLGDTGTSTFKEMARIQKITGLEMSKLIAMTDKFDTFEGAAEQAGSLNAALGGNFVDSMSLMMAQDPAERFKMIRDAIDESGKSLDNMGYFQKKFMANAAGFDSVSDFAKAMSGDLDAASKDAAKADGSDAIATLEDAATNIRSQTELALNAAKAIEPAYGTLATKAMVITDKVAPDLMKAAQKINDINIALTKQLPDQAAFFAGSVEGAMGAKDKLMGIFATLQSLMFLISSFPERAKKFVDFAKNAFGGLKKVVETSLKRPVEIFGNLYKKVDDLANVLSGKFTSGALKKLVKRAPIIGGVLSGIFNAVDQMKKAFESFINGNIAEGVGNVFASIFKFADGFLSAIPGFFVWIGQLIGIVDSELDAGSLISELFAPLFDGLMKSYLTMIENFEGFTSDFVNMLKEIPQFVLDIFVDLTSLIPMMMDSVLEAFGFDGFVMKLHEGLVDAISIAFNAMISAGKTVLGIASPSKVFTDMGSNIIASLIDTIKSGVSVLADTAMLLIDGFLAPWKTLGGLLMEVISPALDMVPDSIKNLFMRDTADTAGTLNSAAARAEIAKAGNPAGAAAAGQAQVINISLNLDGKEIDKKVINLLGGVVKEAVL